MNRYKNNYYRFLILITINVMAGLFLDGCGHIGPTTSNMSKKWSYSTRGYIYSSPAIGIDGTIYIGSDDHHLYALNPNGGLKWSYTTGGSIDSSPVLSVWDTIYIISDGLYAINANGTLQWTYNGIANVWPPPPALISALGVNGTLYAGSANGNFYAINSTGVLKWSYTTGGSIESSSAIGADGTIYVDSSDNILYAIDPTGGLK